MDWATKSSWFSKPPLWSLFHLWGRSYRFVGTGSWREEGTRVKSLGGLARRKLLTSGLDSVSPAWSQLLSAVQAFHPSPSVYHALLNGPACPKSHMTVLPRFSFQSLQPLPSELPSKDSVGPTSHNHQRDTARYILPLFKTPTGFREETG